ncbi:MAG: ABC transporter permease [Eubacterium sp.]|nr:ABC transporter permease [Eubacterium sp.]
MEQLRVITKRNLMLYLRDKGAVFFSLLSMLIIIGLMVLFLGDAAIQNIQELLAQFPGHDTTTDETNARLFVLSWNFAGILSVNAVTVTLSALSSMIKDKTSGRIKSIYTAPVSRMVLALGYVLAAWAASVMICTLTLVITECYGVACGMEWFSVTEHIKLMGMILVNSFAYAAFMYVAAVLVRSEGSWSGFGTVVGTLVGFLGGIYLAIGQLSQSVGRIMKCTPVIYGTSMFRQVMTEQIMEKTFDGIPEEAEKAYREVMGIDLFVFDQKVSVGMSFAVLLIFGVIFLMIGAACVKYGRKDC